MFLWIPLRDHATWLFGHAYASFVSCVSQRICCEILKLLDLVEEIIYLLVRFVGPFAMAMQVL